MTRRNWGFLVLPLALVGLAACGDDASDDAALDGAGGGSCTIEDKGDGTAVIRCADGGEFTVSNGKPGTDGKDGKDGADGAKGEDGKDAEEPPCVLSENADGSHTLTCGDQSVVVGAPCEGGFPGNVEVTKEDELAAKSNLLLFQVSSCTWVRGDVLVYLYPGEELPKALARIQKIDGSIEIAQNAELTSVSFPALTTVGGGVGFAQNPKLTATTFPALETVGVSFMWLLHDELTTVAAPKLTEVGATLGWVGNPKIEQIPDFPELTTVGGDMGWASNAGLVSIGAFPKLKTVTESLVWEQNGALEDMGSFDALESLGGFEFEKNAKIEAIVDFPKLTAIGTSGLVIDNNAELTKIDGLGGVTKVEGKFTVTNNPKLPVCDVWDLVGEIQDADGIDGAITVTGNDNTDDSCLVL